MFKNALVSVSDKTGLVDFLKPFVAGGLRVVSTGGTLKHLREHGIQAIDVAEQTGFQELMDGRVKTLHPRVHMALLARMGHSEDVAILKKENLEPFDLVVVNLYPFEAARAKETPVDELIEFIDIGGPSMLRSAAKSHDRIAVICEPDDYGWIQAKSELTLSDRRRLAARVFAHTSRYDDLIAKTFAEPEERPKTLVGQVVTELRYGENPHQKAWWFRSNDAKEGLHSAEIVHGKPLSYNNILDLDAAVGTLSEFSEPCAVAVKHNNPCGIGTDSTIAGAVERALLADPVSVFGGIIALNRVVDIATAEAMSKIFIECVIAPGFSQDALDRLRRKKDLRLLAWPSLESKRGSASAPTDDSVNLQFRSLGGGTGFLVQEHDHTSEWSDKWKVVGAADGQTLGQTLGQTVGQISPQVKADLALAWKACARLKSNAIAIAFHGRTVGLGMGQVNRVDAVEQAIARVKKHHANLEPGADICLASDAFFPFPDSVELAAQAGVRWIIQPGGSIRDEEVLARAKALGVTMVLTGKRHFRH